MQTVKEYAKQNGLTVNKVNSMVRRDAIKYFREGNRIWITEDGILERKKTKIEQQLTIINETPTNTDNWVIAEGTNIYTTSRIIANVFGIEHKHVLEKIRTLDFTKEIVKQNIRPHFFLDFQGNKQPEYHISRDGIAFLIPKFNNPKADDFQWAYIEKFNQMERTLKELQTINPEPKSPTDIIRGMLDVIDKKLDVDMFDLFKVEVKQMIVQAHKPLTSTKDEKTAERIASHLGFFTSKGNVHSDFINKIVSEMFTIQPLEDNAFYRTGSVLVINHTLNIVYKYPAYLMIKDWLFNNKPIESNEHYKRYSFTKANNSIVYSKKLF